MRRVGQLIPHGIDRRRTQVDQFSIRNGKKPGGERNMRGKQGRGFQRKKSVKGEKLEIDAVTHHENHEP